LDHPHTMLLTIIIDGLFMSVVTSDLIVAKMASRQLHTFVAITAMVSVFSNVLTLVLCVGYYIRVFHEISKGLHLPLFIPIVNIFVDGVYDLCHVDHHLQIQFAAQHGDRVFVGVVPDEEAKGYKREPIMTEREREESVRANKDTYMVVKSPASGVTEEMLRKLNIHKVVVGEEYCDPSNAKLYAYAACSRCFSLRYAAGTTSPLVASARLYPSHGVESFPLRPSSSAFWTRPLKKCGTRPRPNAPANKRTK